GDRLCTRCTRNPDARTWARTDRVDPRDVHTPQPWRAAAHPRELLMACEVLPRAGKQIRLLERWLIAHLDAITDPGRAQLIQRFATWEVLPRLRARAAIAFLDWLAARQRTLHTCDQTDIDTRHAEHAEHWRRRLRGFPLWAMPSKLTRQPRLPAPVTTHGAPMPHHERMTLPGHPPTDHELPLRSRAAAVIVLLYAQPLSRIVRLTADDIIRDQPMHPTTLAALVHKPGVPTRTAAIRQHLRDMPAAVVTDALSYHPVTTAKIAAQIGVTWSRYAPGDHTRTGDS
ncbi:MAG TPA: hypothetical protein VFO16_14025, partial [Pseudonocardiaceae bacterium]|nr:hypothetical protein [Pseudonocardiaceae bacterium]